MSASNHGAGSNHDRVGTALRLLSQGLAPFVEREARAKWGDDWMQRLTEAVSGADRGSPSNTNDPSFLLRAMVATWHMVFRNVLGNAERSYVSEIREYRNRWAHQDALSDDDAERALDSIRRLLLAVSSIGEANQVEEMRQELRRAEHIVHGQRSHRDGVVGPAAFPATGAATPSGIGPASVLRPLPNRSGSTRDRDEKPRRDGTRWELWEDEAIADLYIRYGPNGGGTARRAELAHRMERTPATVLMRLGNLRAIVEGRGLSGYAKQTLAVAKSKGLV